MLVICIILISLVSFASADIIREGYRGIHITNHIQNLEDFPDYVFISYGQINPAMCPIKIIDPPGREDTGQVEIYYKHCSPSIYAIPKDKFNGTELISLNTKKVLNEQGIIDYVSNEEIISYLNSVGAIEVIKKIQTYTEVPIASTEKERDYFYTIDLNQVKEIPDNKKVVRNSLVYIFAGVSILALIGIITAIIFSVKKRK